MEQTLVNAAFQWPLLSPALLVGALGTLLMPLLGLWAKESKTAPFIGIAIVLAAVIIQASSFPIGSPFLTTCFLLTSFALVVFHLLCLKEKDSGFEWETASFIQASALGVWIILEANSLPLLFLGLELMSLPIFFLVGLPNKAQSAEASIKYFLMGLVSSAVMVYGMSWIYGETGSLNIGSMIQTENNSSALSLGLILVFGGLFFKIGAFPFHFWVSDVFRTAPYSVNFWLSTSTKVGGLSALSALMPIWPNPTDFGFSIWPLIALFTLSVGNVLALGSQSFIQLLGFSSIAHTGFMMLAASFSPRGNDSSLLTYWLYYFPAIAGLFLLLKGVGNSSIPFFSWAGWGKVKPFKAAFITLLLVNLTGLPPLSGFLAKIAVINSTFVGFGAGSSSLGWWLLAGVLLNTAIALVYYLKLPFYMFFRDGGTLEKNNNSQVWLALGASLAILGLLQFLYPEQLLFNWRLAF